MFPQTYNANTHTQQPRNILSFPGRSQNTTHMVWHSYCVFHILCVSHIVCVTCGVCHTYCVCVSNVASVTYFVFAKYIVFYILLVPCNGAKTGHSMVSTGHRVHYINCMCHIYVSCVCHITLPRYGPHDACQPYCDVHCPYKFLSRLFPSGRHTESLWQSVP